MATKTTNYNLTKPSGSENADIDVINANMDTIDSALSGKADKSEIPDISNLATKSEIPDVSGFANKSDLTNLATKSEIPDVSGYLPKSGGTMSGSLDFNSTTAWITPYLLAFKNDDVNQNPTYPYTGFYQWGSQWQVNARDANNTHVHNLLNIDNVTKIATFGARPTVEGLGDIALKSEIPDTSKMMTTDTAQTITGAKAFTGTVGNTQSSPGVYLGLDTNYAPNANMAIVSANTASYIDMGAPNEDYGFRIIKWKGTSGDVAQFTYGGGGTITVPNATGTMALTSQIPDVSGKQDKLTAGSNITISGTTISAKDTTYGVATTSANGLMSSSDKSKLNGLPSKITISTADPSGGSNGDLWFKYE